MMKQPFIASRDPSTGKWKLQPQGDPGYDFTLTHLNDIAELLGTTRHITPLIRNVPTLWRHDHGYSLEAILPPASGHVIDTVTAINRGGTHPGCLRIFAHSMGNVVASQALRLEGIKDDAQEIVHSYAACQAASVAFAYESINPRKINKSYINGHPSVTGGIKIAAVESTEIPEVYGHFPYAFPKKKEYFAGIDGVVAGNIANVHNWTDSALADWMVGQWQKPDGYSLTFAGLEYRVGWGYSSRIGDGISDPVWWRQDGITGWQMLSLYSDAPEVLAHIAEAKSPALGASVERGNSTQNVINRNLDTMTAFSEEQRFKGDAEDHSAQFRSINMRRWEFWDRLLRHPEIFDVKTEYPEPQ